MANVLIDPGIGFGKTLEHNLALLRATRSLATIRPVLVGPSRKRFIGTLTDEPAASRRQFGTAAAVGWCVAEGASAIRVHDVKAMRQVVQVADAIGRAGV